jgi:hypothetical protein
MKYLKPPKFSDFVKNEPVAYRFYTIIALVFVFGLLIRSYTKNETYLLKENQELKEKLEKQDILIQKNEILQLQINELIKIINNKNYENRGSINNHITDSVLFRK